MAVRGATGIGMTRRSFLAVSGGLTAAALTGCSPRSGGTHGGPNGDIKIPAPKVKLPKGKVSFSLMDSDDTKAPFWKQLFDAYQKKHPNISCTYDGMPWNKIEEVLPLGIKNGTAQDGIQLPTTIPLTRAVSDGWLAPLDDLVPDFAKWKASFPELTFAEGAQMADGKVYMVRLASDRRHYALLHYNTKYLQDAGYDPSAKSLTWDEFRTAARKVTKAGDKRYYGVVIEAGQPLRLESIVDWLAAPAGGLQVGSTVGPYVDPKSGEFYYTNDAVVGAIELLLALKKDGSVFPGSNSMLAPECWPRVARGQAGMVMGGPWVTVLYETQNPDFHFGVGDSPVTGSDPLPKGYSVIGGDGIEVYAKSKAKEVAADVLMYASSMDGQAAWAKICGVGNPAIRPEAMKALEHTFKPQSKQCLALADKLVAKPEPLIANPDTAKVPPEEQPLSPNFGEVIQAIFVGETTNVRKALTDLKDRAERARDDAIAKARKKGAKVSREDWVFTNWDPRKDYTKADYQKR